MQTLKIANSGSFQNSPIIVLKQRLKVECQKSEIFLFSILKFTNPFSEVPVPYSIFTHNLCCPSMRTRKLHYARACKNYARVLQKPENTAGCERLRATKVTFVCACSNYSQVSRVFVLFTEQTNLSGKN